jgi:hypothetical protein
MLPSQCPLCTPIAHCTSFVTCQDDSTSRCTSCQSGYYLAPGSGTTPDQCLQCSPLFGCTTVSCTTAFDSVCQDGTTTSTTSTLASTTTTESGPTTTTSTVVVPTTNAPTTSTTNLAVTTTTTLPSIADFNCYKVRDLRNPRFVPKKGVSLEDQFGTTIVDVKRPYLLCAPASRDGGPAPDEATHMCCYRTRAAQLPDAAQARTTDGFGNLTVQVRRSTLTCLPCTKQLVP